MNPGIFKHLALSLAGVMVFAACSTNPITGRSQYMIVSHNMAVSQSAAAYGQMMGGLAKKNKIETGTPRAEKVREITEKLVAQAVRFRPDAAGWQWEVQLIDDPKVVNAFCMAGGKMAIYTGFWEKLKASDDEIAQVMGHEIAHALADHTRERMSIAMTSQVGTQIAAVAIASRENQGFALAGAQMAALLAIQLPNSRDGESEADQIGIELAARAGFDPAAAATLWEKMGKDGKGPPEFLSTHPSPQNRAARLRELGAKVQPLYLAAKAGPPSGAPKFLAAKEAINERVVTRPGEPTREEYAKQGATDTLTFLAAPFERFKRGETVLECRANCAYGYNNGKAEWKKLHAAGRWRDLAVAVVQVGYLSDLSYYLLAEAAKGLELKEASAAYYKRALDAGREHGCAAEGCEGFEVQRLAKAALGS
ncbi:MAG: M48 family metallopeptidase [Betaproteobacteria bacterium]